jgi:hypothetical protein
MKDKARGMKMRSKGKKVVCQQSIFSVGTQKKEKNLG